jgi:hypothetical protein
VPGAVPTAFAGEVLTTLEEARMWHWCLNDYGLWPHSDTQRRPLEHFPDEDSD